MVELRPWNTDGGAGLREADRSRRTHRLRCARCYRPGPDSVSSGKTVSRAPVSTGYLGHFWSNCLNQAITLKTGCLELLSKKFKKTIADECGDHGNPEIGSGEDISDGPNYTPL